MGYVEKEHELPIYGSFDVIVCGGGPAGFSAAVSSARLGAKTLLIEYFGALGGVATTGLMSHWTGETKGGIYEEILEKSNDSDDPSLYKTINPERLKGVMLEMLIESGAELLLYTIAVDSIMDGDCIKGVIIENKSGRQAVYGKQIIDATGDGDIAARSGAEFDIGRDDGLMQPMTVMFKVANVDYDKAIFLSGFEDDEIIDGNSIQGLGKVNLPSPAGHVLLYKSTTPGVVTCNMTNITDVDGTNADDLTKADVACRRQIPIIVDFLRRNVPGYENCYLHSTANAVGVRETRRFKGLYTLTEEDILDITDFDDNIVVDAHFNFDVHNITGSGLDDTGVQKHFTQPKGYNIPYRCLVPIRIENLFLSGRNISGTHMAHSNYRVMPICANIGQAAGVAAALCAKNNCLPRELNIDKLQNELRKQGVDV